MAGSYELGWTGQPCRQILLLLLLPQLLGPAAGAAARSSCDLGPLLASNLTASSVLLTWSSGTCARDVASYSVQVTHQSWQACPDNLEPSSDSTAGSGVLDYSVSFTMLPVTRLYPYSSYVAVVKGLAAKGELLAEAKVEFQTEADVPDTRPSPLTNQSITYQRGIKFVWSEENHPECIHRNGRSDGFLVELFGVDEWVVGPVSLDQNTFQGTQFYAANLLPYTTYKLRVYNRNIGGLVNQQIYLDIQERTLPAKPESPGNLSLRVISERSVFLSWSPAYPNTGLIEQYELRLGEFKDEGDEPSWSRLVNVSIAHHRACQDTHNRSAEQLAGQVVVCYVVDNLLPGTQYALQVRTWNQDVAEPSPWSALTTGRTESVEYSTELIVPTQESSESTPSIPGVSSPEGMGSSSLIIILCLAGAAVVFIVIIFLVIYKLKYDRLKARLRLQQSLSEPGYTPAGSTHTQGTSYSSSPTTYSPTSLSWDIQTRRLPEPPPVKAGSDPFYTEAYEMAKLPPGYLDMSPSRRASRLEGEDVEGYLRPTFPPPGSPLRHSEAPSCESQDSDYVSECQEGLVPIIPLQSYGHAPAPSTTPVLTAHTQQSGGSEVETGDRLLARPSSPTSQNSRTSSGSYKRYSPSEPLVVSKSVEI